jgi:CheY-like chemotaxis protein
MTDNILLVDDEAGIRKVLGISLADLGYTVHSAENGAAALKIIETVRPAITSPTLKCRAWMASNCSRPSRNAIRTWK